MFSPSKKPSHAAVQCSHLPEFGDREYSQDVLWLEAPATEETLDQDLSREAAQLGIEIAAPKFRESHASLCDSAATIESRHTRTGSTGSRASTSTGATSRSSSVQPAASGTPLTQAPKRWQRFLPSPEVRSYGAHIGDVQQSSSADAGNATLSESTASIFSVPTRKSYKSLKDGIKSRLGRRKPRGSTENADFCMCCRDEFEGLQPLHNLPCSHKCCEKCLRDLIQRATAEELKIRPECCGNPIPGSIIKSILTRDEQRKLLKTILQYSAPWEERIFCPNVKCGEFISGHYKVDPGHPFDVVCRKCRTRACFLCKRGAHKLGQNCPTDWELDVALQLGDSRSWRRCYRCRALVELIQGSTHITCHCKAQFCYICSAMWSPLVGCPNFCNGGEEQLEGRSPKGGVTAAVGDCESAAEEAVDVHWAAGQLETIKRSEQSEELNELRAKHENERDRFISFERKMKWDMWTRQGQLKFDVHNYYGDLQSKMVERHAKTLAHLEDRQVAAEMELRSSLKQSERSVHIRLRHMEAYCDGLGRSETGSNPARVVTERDLQELGQQYSLRDDLERLHQSRINVLREKQSKQVEQLLARQDEEIQKLAQKQAEELDTQEETFSIEEEKFNQLFKERRQRLQQRWVFVDEITRRNLEKETGLGYAKLPELDWPDPEIFGNVSLESKSE